MAEGFRLRQKPHAVPKYQSIHLCSLTLRRCNRLPSQSVCHTVKLVPFESLRD